MQAQEFGAKQGAPAVLVTGASGYLGRAVVKRLVAGELA